MTIYDYKRHLNEEREFLVTLIERFTRENNPQLERVETDLYWLDLRITHNNEAIRWMEGEA